jgi:hypothetical protein
MWMKRAVSVSWIHLSSLIRAGHVPVGLKMHGRADNEAEVSPAVPGLNQMNPMRPTMNLG